MKSTASPASSVAGVHAPVAAFAQSALGQTLMRVLVSGSASHRQIAD